MLSDIAAVSRPPVVVHPRPTAAIGDAAPESYGDLPDCLTDALSGPMTRSQAATLKSLAVEAYQPKQFERDLSRAEAARRIEALKQEIALADSF